MNKFFLITIMQLCLLVSSCHFNKTLINTTEIEPFYTKNNRVGANDELFFWEQKYKLDTTNYTPAMKYAQALVANFTNKGTIENLIKAKQILLQIQKLNPSESGVLRSLANVSISTHEFQNAYNYAYLAKATGEKQYESNLLLFDTALELGKIPIAQTVITKLKRNYEYAYYFRLAKLNHYKGEIEKTIENLQLAVTFSENNIALKQAALSNLGDFQLNHGNFEEAKIAYLQAVKLHQYDSHSLIGLAKIAAIHDKNFTVAEEILMKINAINPSPETNYQLMHLAILKNNKKETIKYAQLFENQVSKSIYGNMYNKYLIEIYSSILPQKTKLLEIAANEIKNRNTPTANTWYCLALQKNNKGKQAMQHYKNHVANQPLEANELYYIAQLMYSENKNYLADKFMEEAQKNEVELCPQFKKANSSLL